jgi:hypothetical protein
MIKLTRIQTRPSTAVNFYLGMPKASRDTIFTTFQGANPKLVQNNSSISADKLSFIQTLVFSDVSAKNEYLANSVVVADDAARLTYCSANGITFSETVA